jgi:hypothetical protein
MNLQEQKSEFFRAQPRSYLIDYIKYLSTPKPLARITKQMVVDWLVGYFDGDEFSMEDIRQLWGSFLDANEYKHEVNKEDSYDKKQD